MSMQRFLAATDGTRDGDHAVRMGQWLAQQADGEFARLAVETSAPNWEPRLEWWREPAAPGGTATRLRGLPGIEIVRYAESWEADLVVLGRHDHTPEHPLQLGPTSDTVIRRRAGISLFVPPRTVTVKRALIALDGSLRGLAVVAPAVPFLNLTRARTRAICVLPGSTPDPTDNWRDVRHERASVLIDRLQLQSGRCELLMRWGDPVQEVLRAIEETAADLLILGVRRGGLRGDLGSGYVGRELLKSAPCAVLTVPI
ncbi:MAG TPA: universal stress protein [Gemmatimonadales bacterium]|jgi:nucleotide-binding universal stress UspA family protein|nr:universal stress protein [Gemmatimonadales bacterium]